MGVEKAGKVGSRALMLLCVIALIASVVPLYAIAMYNHPYYDDYGFSTEAHDTWTQTSSVEEVLKTALASSREVRFTWQGTYTGTFLSNIQPGVFGERYYGLCTVILLTAFLICFGFGFNTFFRRVCGLGGRESATFTCLALTLMTQLMPDPGEAFYWYNGGIGNIFIYSLLVLSFALACRLCQTKSVLKAILITAALALLTIPLGGGGYGSGLFGLCAYAALTLWLFVKRRPRKWVFYTLTLAYLSLFIYNAMAPGNAVRAGYIGSRPDAVTAVVKAVYYGIAQMGTYMRLPLLGVSVLVVPALYSAAKASAYRFRHPWLALLILGALYCTQLVPPLYAGVFIGGGRIINNYFISFVAMWFLYLFYLLGYIAKRAEAPARLPRPLRRGLAFAAALALAAGCLAYKPEGATLYGAQNLAGVSAAISLVNGEAAQYDREMDAREALLNDASLADITLSPLTVRPRVFMPDLLSQNASYDVTPALKRYYHKNTINIAYEEGAQ